MKMLFFDFRDSEKIFFETHKFQDLDITFYKHSLNKNTKLTQREKDETEIISIFVTSQLTEEVISQFKNLRIIATRSIGYNHIQLDYCENKHISVVNVEGYGKNSVAQYTIGTIIALIRNFLPAITDFETNNSNYDKYTGYDLSELTLGIIGTGSIGSSVCKIANNFNMHIFAHDYKINPEIKDFVDYVSLEELYRHSNIISLHIPYVPEVYHLISDKEFEMMKKGTFIINTSRGELIDNLALYKAVMEGKIAGAALDVLECENLNMYPDDFVYLVENSDYKCLENTIINNKLMEMENIIITPHIAYNTYNAVNTILKETFSNIKNCINGKCTNKIV